METLNTRSLHSTDHRFAVICSGRDDRVGEIGTFPVKPKPGLSGPPDSRITLAKQGEYYFREGEANEKLATSEKRRTYMTREARLMSGIILITVPTIQYGGYFLLTSLMSKSSAYMENPLRQNFFRAGHAHAGVIVILSLICEMLADSATLPISLLWFVRIGVPLAAILISAGFFFSMLPPAATQANGAVSLIYVGAVVLAIAVVSLGVGLLRALTST
jgi:hypothetical protein